MEKTIDILALIGGLSIMIFGFNWHSGGLLDVIIFGGLFWFLVIVIITSYMSLIK